MLDRISSLGRRARDALSAGRKQLVDMQEDFVGEVKAGQQQPGHQPGHRPGQHQPGQPQPRQQQPGHKPGHRPGQHQPGQHRPGQQRQQGNHTHAGGKASGGPGFRVLVDINQMTVEEGARAHELCCDGILMIMGNTQGRMPWRQVCQSIHGAKPHGTIITEDVYHVGPENREPPQARNYNACFKLGMRVDYAFVYNSGQGQYTLTPQEVRKIRGLYGNKLLIHLRAWTGVWKRNSLASLQEEGVLGACMELGASVDNLIKHNGVGFAREMIAMGKVCFFLMPPTPGTVNYAQEVNDVVSHMGSHGVDTSSPLLHIIIAVYERHKKPISGFFDGGNTVLAALRVLQGREDCCCCLPAVDGAHTEL